MINVLKLLPIIVGVVQSIEALMPASASKDKLAAALKGIESIYGVLGETVPAVTKFVAVVVSALHSLGLFVHKKVA